MLAGSLRLLSSALSPLPHRLDPKCQTCSSPFGAAQIDHFKVPDKWGFCSAFSDFLPLGKSGEGPAPMDSTTMQKTVWRRQGRLTPYEILKRKKRHLNELVEQGKVLKQSQEVPTIVLPGKVSKG